MKLVSIDSCSPGMKLGRTIYTDDGKVLLGYGFELTQGSINRLRGMGIHQIYIDDPRTGDITIKEVLSSATRNNVYKALNQCIEYIRNKSKGPASEYRFVTFSKLIFESAAMIISDVTENQTEPIIHIRTTALASDSVEDHFCNNALNVAVIAVKLAMLEGAKTEELRSVCLAALFHDIGKLLIPNTLLTKSAKLSEEEMATIRRHTELGYKFLKEDGTVPLTVAQCALQHHERIDGLGYPYGLKDQKIHPFAKLVGMVDAYDALISHRSYREAMLPHDAMDFLYAHSHTAFDHKKVELFRNNVAIFPPGMTVTLSTGEQGVISQLDLLNLQRPTVRILTDIQGEPLAAPYDLPLSKHLNIMIRSVG